MLPEGLIIVQVDDDEIVRIVAETLPRLIRADEARSLILGETRAEVIRIPAMLSRLDARHERIVLILDQHMHWVAQGEVEGLALCAQLRAGGWGGVIIIRSANDEPTAQAEYLARAQACRIAGSTSVVRPRLQRASRTPLAGEGRRRLDRQEPEERAGWAHRAHDEAPL
jgi:CheY-like chemotaxis protein